MPRCRLIRNWCWSIWLVFRHDPNKTFGGVLPVPCRTRKNHNGIQGKSLQAGEIQDGGRIDTGHRRDKYGMEAGQMQDDIVVIFVGALPVSGRTRKNHYGIGEISRRRDKCRTDEIHHGGGLNTGRRLDKCRTILFWFLGSCKKTKCTRSRSKSSTFFSHMRTLLLVQKLKFSKIIVKNFRKIFEKKFIKFSKF